MKTHQTTEHHQCLIIGSGPAGYTAAIYAARADLKPIIYTGMQAGGQLTQTTDVDNFPGYPNGIMGPEMMEDFRKQAERFGTEIRFGYVSQVDLSARPKRIIVDEIKEVTADTVIIATGASAKWLGIPGEQQYNGFGVSACAVCDGFFFKGLSVAIIGGGDTAAEEAIYLAKLCARVHLLIRGEKFRASKVMVSRVLSVENIIVHYNTEAKEVLGDGKNVTGLVIKNKAENTESLLEVDGVFVSIGHKPNTDIFTGQLDMDDTGYLLTQPDSTRTKIDGVFVCGDVQDMHYRQAITAAGSGCMAALDAERYLANTHQDQLLLFIQDNLVDKLSY
jgi:thioredoxin reductase (NADPH)